jgi:dTDP-4-amino-4,6-dideoxygalactose transaminase
MKLAINGGKAIVEPQYRKFAHPAISSFLQQGVLEQLHEDISIYDNGGIYHKFEKLFGEILDFDGHVLTTNSGTTALYSMFFGLDLHPGDEVIVPSYTFFATATPLLHFGVVLKFADCLDNGNIDPARVEELITPQTKAVVITHMWGIPCDMAQLLRICRENNVMLVEDASHAHCAKYDGKFIGTFSDAAAWSFQGKKVLTCGEGGVFATKHNYMFERAVLVGHFNKRAKKEVFTKELAQFNVTGFGLNLRMHPLGAAIGYSQLQKADYMLRERQETAEYMLNELNFIDGLSPMRVPDNAQPAWYAFPIKFDSHKFSVSMAEFVKALNAEGAEEADIPGATCPLNRHPIFNNPSAVSHLYDADIKCHTENKYFKQAEDFHSSMFKLPTWYGTERMNYAYAYMEAIKKVSRAYG